MFYVFSLFLMYFCAPANKSEVQSVKKYSVIDQNIATCDKAGYLNCVNPGKGGELECAKIFKCSADVLADVDNPNAILAAQNTTTNTPNVKSFSFGNNTHINTVAPTATYPGQAVYDANSGTYVPVPQVASQTQQVGISETQMNAQGYTTAAQCAATLESCMQYLGGVDACYSGDSSEKRYQCPKNDGRYETYLKIENANASDPPCTLSTLRICLDGKGGDSCYGQIKGNNCKSYRVFQKTTVKSK